MVTAGDADLAGDTQGYHWVRNSHAHPMDPLSTATVALNADEPERSMMANTAKRQTAILSSAAFIQAGASIYWTTRRVTWRSPRR